MIRLSQRLMTMIDDGRKGNNMGLSTGISKLDSLIYGVQRKWMYVVGAASGGGLKKKPFQQRNHWNYQRAISGKSYSQKIPR